MKRLTWLVIVLDSRNTTVFSSKTFNRCANESECSEDLNEIEDQLNNKQNNENN